MPELSPWKFKRCNLLDEETLTAELRHVAWEIDLDTVAGSSAKLLAARKPAPAQAALDFLAGRADLSGLPVRTFPDCQLDKNAAERLEGFSLVLREALFELEQRKCETNIYSAVMYLDGGLRHEQKARRPRRLGNREAEFVTVQPSGWLEREGISALVQVFQGEEKLVRSLLARVLARSQSPAASVALARLALFDLSEEVREQAVLALVDRPRPEYRQVLLEALRYPWPPVADHAAEALAALGDREALPKLVDFLDQCDPAAPRIDKTQKMVVPELVRINHLRNCLLCHAPSSSAEDRVRGPVPTPGKPLPSGVPYYASLRGPVIRADITYLKQDFSVSQPVPDHGKCGVPHEKWTRG
jgi:hypothetical protein